MEKYSKNSAIPKIIKKVMPSVVSIAASKFLPDKEKPANAPLGFNGLTIIPEAKKKVSVGGGSGFIVSSDGIIITNRHVVADPLADYIVILHDDRKVPAKVLARDPINDIAVLKVEEKKLPIMGMGDSSKLELGQTVIAIGNVLGTFRNTVSVGVISGLSREIMAGDTITQKMSKLRGLIQTDAAINPGNSGGPLINHEGKVIGVNTAMVFMAENVGFALPINNAKKDLEDLKKYGRIRQPFLGLRYILLDKELKEKFNLPIDKGALVISEPIPEGLAVVPESAAAKAGVKEGDIILEIQNMQVCEKNPLEDILQKCKIGEDIEIKIFRDNQEIVVKSILEERK
jgi:S1-C subfamily serine protease